MRAVAVIPARYASTRLPGKPLLKETGKYLLQHVFDRCRQSRRLARTIIATDDQRIVSAAESFGAEVVMTNASHASGSDRVAEVAASLTEDIVINVQGDEPYLRGEDLDQLVLALETNSSCEIATLATPLADWEEFQNPNVVKVVCDGQSRALYFSRSPIPHHDTIPNLALKHRGVYAFRRDALLLLADHPPVPLELTERLEQLRALYLGMKIHVVMTDHEGIEINTPGDYRRFVEGWTP